jgi:hypothetical protein
MYIRSFIDTLYNVSISTLILTGIIISGVFFKFHLVVGVEESIVNAPVRDL